VWLWLFHPQIAELHGVGVVELSDSNGTALVALLVCLSRHSHIGMGKQVQPSGGLSDVIDCAPSLASLCESHLLTNSLRNVQEEGALSTPELQSLMDSVAAGGASAGGGAGGSAGTVAGGTGAGTSSVAAAPVATLEWQGRQHAVRPTRLQTAVAQVGTWGGFAGC
jgi:hypothetical protein